DGCRTADAGGPSCAGSGRQPVTAAGTGPCRSRKQRAGGAQRTGKSAHGMPGAGYPSSGLNRTAAGRKTDPERRAGEYAGRANATDWQQELERIGERIQRLGAINLAAIEEYQVQSERKVYLDAQNDD